MSDDHQDSAENQQLEIPGAVASTSYHLEDSAENQQWEIPGAVASTSNHLETPPVEVNLEPENTNTQRRNESEGLENTNTQRRNESEGLSKEQLRQLNEQPIGERSSMAFTSFNFVNAIVGSGVIGMPYALSCAGFWSGLLILVGVALLSDASLCILIDVAQEVRAKTYQDLVRIAFGRVGFVLTSCLQFLYPFISLISYNIIVGDTMTIVFIRLTGIGKDSILAKREFIIVASTLLITLPLSLYRNISRLAKVSLISVVITSLIVVAMFARFYNMKDIVPPSADAWNFAGPNLGAAIGVMTFAFMCHHASFLVFDSLENNCQERWNKTTHISIGSSAILSLGFAIAGYATFTGYAQGDIFDNYCWRDDAMNVCRGCFALEILLTYPIECFVARDVIETAFFNRSQQQQHNQPFLRHAILAIVITLTCMTISIFVDCLGVVLELNGIVCAVPLAYILPASCYLRLSSAEGETSQENILSPCCNRHYMLAFFIGTFGVVSFFAGIFSFLSNVQDGIFRCSHGKEPFYC